jgi:UDP-glucose 4-epimerase
VHLAAQAAVPRSVSEPQFDASVNILGTINVLEAAQATGVERLVYISTGGAAYGDTPVLPTPEDHPARAISPYGVSKVTGERYLECWTGVTPMTGMALRLANVYGPRQRADGEAGVVAIFVQRLREGIPCRIYGDGEQTRDYVYVADVAEAAAAALASTAAGVVNVSTARETSVNALYARLCAVLGLSREPEYADARPGDVRRSVLDNNRARAVLGWAPRTSLEEGLALTVQSMRR